MLLLDDVGDRRVDLRLKLRLVDRLAVELCPDQIRDVVWPRQAARMNSKEETWPTGRR
ncbi:MAG TPA: hypothetical protein VMU39_06310 [Solirubrobacteraceae bacterium]|nr:hypothetical protein [Solirubrobacteraceae bacterium]